MVLESRMAVDGFVQRLPWRGASAWHGVRWDGLQKETGVLASQAEVR